MKEDLKRKGKRGEKKKKRKRVIKYTLKYLTTTYSLLALDIG